MWYMQIAEDIRELIDSHQAAFPTVLEIPSKDHPYGRFLLPWNVPALIELYSHVDS